MKPEKLTFSSPDLDARITAGILEDRTSEAVVRLADPAGRPLPSVVVEVEQTSLDFLFGANIFHLSGYPTGCAQRPLRRGIYQAVQRGHGAVLLARVV